MCTIKRIWQYGMQLITLIDMKWFKIICNSRVMRMTVKMQKKMKEKKKKKQRIRKINLDMKSNQQTNDYK